MTREANLKVNQKVFRGSTIVLLVEVSLLQWFRPFPERLDWKHSFRLEWVLGNAVMDPERETRKTGRDVRQQSMG
ncbi:hypothetical protein BO82DRAFT_349766 [Aspergillus uvarum CBS 121591]|uniref:Uncharacterized protein n=1 Tax=Aspergillus uvarum CBS 121591 TaxID=1448315 RepID=A0A319CPD8_9EURO|nr:hypothetical protein BO82DRAFT_349766 [Aspergillus uvarum CBS 121591]PYH87255.1 hypothetical protein BO82DRAFT_349766 [Aspergillus uvarum CBS 121591]